MQMSAEGLALIRRFEGFRAVSYKCPAGVWTIGYGHTSRAGPPAVAGGMTVSEAQAAKILAADVGQFAAGVAALVKRPLTDNQFAALVSFAYNVGLGNFKSSSVLAAVNAGDFAAVPRRLQLWVKGGGRVLAGLVARRAAEAALFMAAAGPEVPAHVNAEAVSPMSGTSPRRSTTIWAGVTALLAGLTSLGPTSLHIAAALLGVAAVLWIIRERLRRARHDGV